MKRVIIFMLVIVCTVGAFARTTKQSIAINRAKELFIANAKGDVKKIKSLTTPKFYREKYPYSDKEVREHLLSVPYEKRQKLIYQVKYQCSAKAVCNSADNVMTVYLKNKVTDKVFTIKLVDKKGNNNWLVFNYEY